KERTPAKRHEHVSKPAGAGGHQHGTPAKPHDHPSKPAGAHEHGAPGTQHDHHETAMKAFLGPYPMTREGAGTSWLPDSTPLEGVHATYGDWMFMGQSLINGVYDHQGGPRGGDKTFVSGMVMGMAERPLGDGTLGLRAMLSPDPFMGPNGYP